ncbi:MAG TPA: adenylate/guanylate cyclase domain-containing protein [Anaerolineales bacterium]|nr:adenylate/guanylate cyclase domain-containing protein [Anaerolineales bacterium]
MAKKPETKYARSGEVNIAYQVTGGAPADVVWAPGTTTHLDISWDWPAEADFIERFSKFCRLIRFDKRGTGLSDRPTNAATLEERTDDIRAVMDAAGSERATIFGVSEGVNMACVFAALYPERTRSLILWGGQARWVRAHDYPWGPTPEEQEALIQHARLTWPSRDYLTRWGAGLGDDVDQAYLDWWTRKAQASASPAAVAALEEMNAQIDTRAILSSIGAPTLVMNYSGDPVANVEAARDLAAHIPGARFVEFPGRVHLPWMNMPDRILAEIEEFVTGAHAAGRSDRFLTTVLFLDIVGSTERAAQLGDSAWLNLLAAFYAAAREELVRFRGCEIDTAGDGFLATFDGPARAIRCALATQQHVRQSGIELHAGLHTGECEWIGEKVGGIALHIGARIAAHARANEVLVSSTVKDLVAGSGIQFEERGAQALKGVPGKWHLYAVAP